MKTGTIRFGCGATAEVDYPEDEPDALTLLRADAAGRACPACETGGDRGLGFVKDERGRVHAWRWRDVTGAPAGGEPDEGMTDDR